jgi:hypothetical protein
MKLKFSAPIMLAEHFRIPVDETNWMPIADPPKPYRKVNGGFTSNRSLASFGSWQKALEPISDVGRNLSKTFGVYMLAFGDPDCECPPAAFYVGVAGDNSKKPEGILTRIKKHRVKVTGANVGGAAASHGGVSHTAGWRQYAPRRHAYYSAKKTVDICADARLVIGLLDSEHHPTNVLEYFEHRIFKNHLGVRDSIYNLLWGRPADKVMLLTAASKDGVAPLDPVVQLWDGSTYELGIAT